MTELELYHYGIKGQKWGVRRYQNKDGTLTPAGKKRHIGIDDSGNVKLIDHPTTKKGIKMFAVKLSISMLVTGASLYIAKHPEVVVKGREAASKVLKKAADTKIPVADSFSGPRFVRNDGKPLTAADLEKLKSLGVLL